MPRLNFTEHTSENLRAVAAELQGVQDTINAAAAFLDGSSETTLLVAHTDSRKDGMRKLNVWCDAVRAAVLKMKEDRGDFASSHANGTATKKKKK